MSGSATRVGEKPVVICLHAAGATSAMFDDFARHIGRDLTVQTVDLPGRGRTFDRAFLRSAEEAVDHVMPALRGLPDRGYVLFGYSMGALIAYELARMLHDGHGPLPAAIVAAAARAPQIAPREDTLHDKDDDALLHELVRLQGTTPKLVADRELMALVLPRLRADFELCETYAFRAARRLPLPVHAFGGREDARVSAEDLAAWTELAAAGSTYKQMPGGHFFIQQESRDIATRLEAIANRWIDRSTSAGRMVDHG